MCVSLSYRTKIIKFMGSPFLLCNRGPDKIKHRKYYVQTHTLCLRKLISNGKKIAHSSFKYSCISLRDKKSFRNRLIIPLHKMNNIYFFLDDT